MSGRVLVLNSTYEPINVCTMRRAIVLILKGVARAEERHETELHSAPRQDIGAFGHSSHRIRPHSVRPQEPLAQKHPAPRPLHLSVLRQGLHPVGADARPRPPRNRAAGSSNWDNLVACCKRCNNRKGNATPEEVGMRLVKRPQSFSMHVNRQIMRYLGRTDAAWRKYLYY